MRRLSLARMTKLRHMAKGVATFVPPIEKARRARNRHRGHRFRPLLLRRLAPPPHSRPRRGARLRTGRGGRARSRRLDRARARGAVERLPDLRVAGRRALRERRGEPERARPAGSSCSRRAHRSPITRSCRGSGRAWTATTSRITSSTTSGWRRRPPPERVDRIRRAVEGSGERRGTTALHRAVAGTSGVLADASLDAVVSRRPCSSTWTTCRSPTGPCMRWLQARRLGVAHDRLPLARVGGQLERPLVLQRPRVAARARVAPVDPQPLLVLAARRPRPRPPGSRSPRSCRGSCRAAEAMPRERVAARLRPALTDDGPALRHAVPAGEEAPASAA